MKNLYEARLKDLKDRMRVWGIDTALVTDDDNVFYLTGYYDYLHMEFGRPTIFIVSENSPSVIITPQIDENSARSLAHCDEISTIFKNSWEQWDISFDKFIRTSSKDHETIVKEFYEIPDNKRGFFKSIKYAFKLHKILSRAKLDEIFIFHSSITLVLICYLAKIKKVYAPGIRYQNLFLNCRQFDHIQGQHISMLPSRNLFYFLICRSKI